MNVHTTPPGDGDTISLETHRLMALFAGFADAYGTYDHTKAGPKARFDPKIEIKSTAKTKRISVTAELWQEHVNGTKPIGIIPVREDLTCVWGCIDIDKYSINHVRLIEQITKLGLPLVVCSSKSGGAHCFAFASEPVPAELMQKRLKEMAVQIGHAGVEIFPKQLTVDYDKGGLANWLNMPYFNAKETDRYCIKPDGRDARLVEFLDFAESKKQSPQWFATSLAAPRRGPGRPREEIDPASLQPPAATLEDARLRLQRSVERLRAARAGERNNVANAHLYWLGVFARDTGLPSADVEKAMKDAWYDAMGAGYEAETEWKSLWPRAFEDGWKSHDKAYGYSQDCFPAIEQCWMNRDHKYRLQIAGKELRGIPADVLLDPKKFNNAAVGPIGQTYRVLTGKNAEHWRLYMQAVINRRKPEDEATGDTDAEMFDAALRDFLTNRNKARERDEILQGRPWFDEDDTGRHYFRIKDLLGFLRRQELKIEKSVVVGLLKALGGHYNKVFNIKGEAVRCWSLTPDQLENGGILPELPVRKLDKDPI